MSVISPRYSKVSCQTICVPRCFNFTSGHLWEFLEWSSCRNLRIRKPCNALGVRRRLSCKRMQNWSMLFVDTRDFHWAKIRERCTMMWANSGKYRSLWKWRRRRVRLDATPKTLSNARDLRMVLAHVRFGDLDDAGKVGLLKCISFYLYYIIYTCIYICNKSVICITYN